VRATLIRVIIQLAFVASAVGGIITLRHSGPVVILIAIFTYISVLVITLAAMLNYPRMQREALVSEYADELASKNLLVCTSYQVDRAFRVAAREEGEGPHYFLELENGAGVLHLCGAYLYDYEPINGAQRHFPCTSFTIRRHAEVGMVVDILCGGLVIEPEVDAPPFTDEETHKVPEDGQILRPKSFDHLRRERKPSSEYGLRIQ
jgi:hypothetical protein